jgi:2-keto-4-pentenoate hydratase/2-oxohepta-3-ene-1,7-dioic acid hydratase in catechol pathway
LKLVAFEEAGRARLGVLRDGNKEIVDLAVAAPSLPRDLMGLIAQGAAGFAAARDAAAKAPAGAIRPLADLKYALPIAAPSKIICLGLNYADHAAEGGNKVPEYPAFFLRGPSSLVEHGAPIIRPCCSPKLDFEAELVAVIGKRARHLTADNALSVVAGYSCFNDGSIRDYQRKSSQWTIGKNFDATGAFGPWFVTADALPPGAVGLGIQSRLNGQVMQNSNTRNMIVSVSYALQLLSEAMTLEPGDLVVMGTPAGVGYARTPPVWMTPGDTIEIDIEGIGVLSNPIADEAA